MPDISVVNVVKSFEEDKNILDGISFDILEGERVGLLGRNGAGKTTLFRLITGEIYPDEGQISIPSEKRVGIITQIPKFPEDWTAEDVLKSAHRRLYDMRARLDKMEEAMNENSSRADLAKYDALMQEFLRADGYELDRLRNTVANGLRIPQSQREQRFSSLSGGEKTRVNLARLILEDTDILLLDEPTNHLDLRACEWLEDWLTKYKGTVLTASHDRYFLDHVVTRTIDVVKGKAVFYPGNYTFYLAEKQRRLEEQMTRYARQEAERKRLEEARDRLYQWGTGNEHLMKKSFAIQSRIDHMERIDRPDMEKKMRAKFSEKAFRADEAVVMKGVSKGFGERTLFEDLNMMVTGGERIALIGDNGTGKSTLLKLLMGELPPDTGMLKIGPAVKIAYLPQIITFANPQRSVLDTLLYEEGYQPQEARNRLGAFKFSGEDVFRPVSALSGGEQSRLRLCILMRDDINLLVLDEPTNHLDAASREWIEEALEDYGQALLFVSHDRYFISRFATRIWELEDGKITDFRGTFDQYRAWKAQQTVVEQVKKEKERKAKPKAQKQVSFAKQLERLEREIAKQEAALQENEENAAEFASDYEKLMELEAEKAELEASLAELYDQWETLSLRQEEQAGDRS